jgi:hypothetical protein
MDESNEVSHQEMINHICFNFQLSVYNLRKFLLRYFRKNQNELLNKQIYTIWRTIQQIRLDLVDEIKKQSKETDQICFDHIDDVFLEVMDKVKYSQECISLLDTGCDSITGDASKRIAMEDIAGMIKQHVISLTKLKHPVYKKLISEFKLVCLHALNMNIGEIQRKEDEQQQKKEEEEDSGSKKKRTKKN